MACAASPSSILLQYDAWLVEEAVFLRMTGDAQLTTFRMARDEIYAVADPEEREKRFREFHARWFSRLKLGDPLTAALQEQPAIAQQLGRCYVAPASTGKEQGADLHVPRASQSSERQPERTILLRLQPESFLDPVQLRQCLRHELTHIADMLDPCFGYEPQLPASDAGPVYDNLVRGRYRVLWDTWIDGRLFRRGWAPGSVRQGRLEEFTAAFPMCDQEAEKRFEQLFDSDSQTHGGLLAFAANPGPELRPSPSAKPRARPCPLCRLLSFDMVWDTSDLPADSIQELASDFPKWRAEHGVCRQCAELYRARSQSRAAAAMLPGI